MKKTHPIDQELFPPFTGFPPEGLRFLKKLKKNNNRPWFQKNKHVYEEDLRFPMQCLVASLGEVLAQDAPEFEFNPKRAIFRIYRDVRFSKNKAPYKTSIAASFAKRTKKKGAVESPGFYVHIQPGEVFIGGGLYMPSGAQLKAIRNRIASHPDEFLELIRDRKFKRAYGGIQGEKLVRAPLGFPGDHPMIEHLRHKQFYVGMELSEDDSMKPKFLTTTAAAFRTALPFTRWLAGRV